MTDAHAPIPPAVPAIAPVLECRGLHKHFRRDTVLVDVDFTLAPGSVTGLIGRNGAGKSTLIRCLLGLMRADAGTASLLGESPWTMGDAAKERLGYVPQTPDLPGWLNVRQVLDYLGAFYATWDRDMVFELVRRWDLNEKARVGTLSAGQAQILAIIAALGHRPRLLVLDEPAAALDPLARRRFLTAVLEVVSDGGTVLFSTHLTADLERVADRVAALRHGRIAFHGGLDELIERTKRLRTDRPLARKPDVPGLLSCDLGRDGAVMTVHGDVAAAVDRLRAMHDVGVVVDDLNLEDIVVELHR